VITGRRSYPKWLVRGLILFAIGMTAFAAVASREHHGAENARNAALSELVARESRDLQARDPSLAMQLALIAYHLSQTTASRSALIDTTAGEMPTRLNGRPGQIDLAVGDDGHHVAVAYQGTDTVAVYGLRYAQLTLLATVPGSPRGALVDSVALSDNGHLLAVGDGAGHVTLWTLRAAAHPRRLAVLRAGGGAVHGLGFSPSGGALAAADSSGRVQRWSLASPAQPSLAAPLIAPGATPLDAVSYSHDGKTLAAVGARGLLVIWAAHGAATPLAGLTTGTAQLRAVTYSPDGRTLAAGGDDGTVALFTVGASGVPTRLNHSPTTTGAINALAFSRDGRYLAAGTFAGAAPVWSTSDWSQVASLPHPASVTAVAFTDGDRRLITANTTGSSMIWQFPAPSSYVFDSALRGVTYSATEPQLSVALASGRSDLWDVVDEWRPAPEGAWYAARLSHASPDSYWLHRTSVITMTTTSPTGTVTSGTTTTASGTTTTGTRFVVVNPHAGDLALRRTEAQTTVLDSMLSPSGLLFAAAGRDHLVWLWDVSDPARPRLLAKLSGFTSAATAVMFTGNSQTLFAASADHTVRIWSMAKPAAPNQLNVSPLIGPATAITRLALSPDNRTLAASTAAGRVWLWGVANPSKTDLTATLVAARDRLTALAFSPSNNTLVAGGANQRLTFWHYRPYQAVNRICALAGTPITAGEWQLYVPGAAYKPPCARWTPPAPPTTTGTTTTSTTTTTTASTKTRP
jgi:WD40 repeat protein